MGFKLSQMSSSLLGYCPILSDLDPSSNTLVSGPNNLLNLGSVPHPLLQFLLGSPAGLQPAECPGVNLSPTFPLVWQLFLLA